jgi:hypothetical protein
MWDGEKQPIAAARKPSRYVRSKRNRRAKVSFQVPNTRRDTRKKKRKYKK